MFRNVVAVLLSVVCLNSFGQQKNLPWLTLSPSLQRIITTKKSADSIFISVSAKSPLLLPFLKSLPFTTYFFYTGKISTADLLVLAQKEDVLFISEISPAKEEINTGASDPTLNLVSFTQHRYPDVTGETITTSVKERRFDSSDIDLKGRVFLSGMEHNTVTSHASLMATIIAGAGNSSPFAKGAAPAARVTSVSFNNLFPEADSFFQKNSVSVQNHSYGTVLENFYGNEAAAYDQSTLANPALMHIFSAGNAGNTTPSTGTYSGSAEMANLTGNFKQAKNIITVSGVDSIARLLPLSSKGPAYDGRIKPELVAYGEDGSSGAAALVSGAAVMVQDRYHRQYNGLPSSALTKAVLLNSADDVGEIGLDFRAGYGSLNAFKAVRTIADGRFFLDSVAQNGEKLFRITVPANASQLKLTVVWNDLPAAPNAQKALVNDLDVVLQSPVGQSWLPWVLNSAPGSDSLQQPAQRKRDTLNNVEQITVDDPPAGEYTINITGTAVQSGHQTFALAYETEVAGNFYWTFPTASDHLVAGNMHTLRWETNFPEIGKVEFATNGDNWREAGTIDSLKRNYFKWAVPDTVSTARLRLNTGTATFISDTFTINPQLSLQTGFNCPDSFMLFWNEAQATSYRLYQLGEKYLEPVFLTSDTALILLKSQSPSLYYSVAPVINGKEGIRSNSSNYMAQGGGCYLRSFYLQTQSGTTANFVAQLGTLYNVTEVRLEAWIGNAFIPVQTVGQPQTTSFAFDNIPLHAGENRFRFSIKLANNIQLYSSTETVYAVTENWPVYVYPNPVQQSGELKILTREVGRYKVILFDISGKNIYEKDLNRSVSSLPVSQFAKGIYFITIYDSKGKIQTLKQVIL